MAKEKSSSLQLFSNNVQRRLKIPSDRCSPGMQTYTKCKSIFVLLNLINSHIVKWNIKYGLSNNIVVELLRFEVTMTYL